MQVRKNILITNLEFQPKPTESPVVDDKSFKGVLNLEKLIKTKQINWTCEDIFFQRCACARASAYNCVWKP